MLSVKDNNNFTLLLPFIRTFIIHFIAFCSLSFLRVTSFIGYLLCKLFNCKYKPKMFDSEDFVI